MNETTIEIPDRLHALAEFETYEGRYDVRTIDSGADEYRFARPLEWQVTVTNTGGALLVAGTVSGRAETDCARCVEPFEMDVFGEVEGYFVIRHEDEAPEDELEGDEFDVLPENGAVDLAPLLTAAILVELPFVPLHDEACAGLCPRCGKNLNEGPCDCAPADGEDDREDENPFAVLKGYAFE